MSLQLHRHAPILLWR